jgi:MGT family glycosyltransferase
MGKRFLFVLWEGGGNVPPQLGVARKLVARGHQVRVLGDRALAAQVAAAGCAHVPWPTAPHHNLRDRAADTVRDWEPALQASQFQRFADGLLFGPAEAYARDVLAEARAFAPDAICVDQLLFGALVGAEASGAPTAMLVHTVGMVRIDGLPPFGAGFHPARGRLGRLRDRVVWTVLERMMRKGLPSLNAARRALGLAPLASAFALFERPRRGLILTSSAFDYPASLPPHLRYVGPQLDDPAWAEAPAAPAEVLVALGSTFQDQRAVTQRTIDALGGLPVRGLVTLGNVFEPSELRAPANVTVVRSAPHAAVLPGARACVAHGGHGTVMKALAHGVPVLSIPLGRDQADVAARVTWAGAGLTVPRSASPRRIRAALVRLLEEPRFAEAARRLGEAVARDARSPAVVEELEALAAASSVSRAAG